MARMDERDLYPESGGSFNSHGYSQTLSPAIPSSITINLGVLDVPYANRAQTIPKAKKGKKARPVKREPNTQTTGDVAEWLEEKYGVMASFADTLGPGIVETIKESLVGSLENLMAGAPAGNPFPQAETDIDAMFKDFIISQEAEHVGMTGVPTQAALRGVNHRLKHPYRKTNARRPSFLDTGLYVQSFRAWIE